MYKFYREQMLLKQNDMRLSLLSTMESAITDRGVKGIFGKEIDLQKDINLVFEGIMKYKQEQNTEDNYKMKGLYSYNWLDHPDYIYAKKVEKKIMKYRKNLSKAQVLTRETRSS